MVLVSTKKQKFTFLLRALDESLIIQNNFNNEAIEDSKIQVLGSKKKLIKVKY